MKIEFLVPRTKPALSFAARSQLRRMLDFVESAQPNDVFSLTDSVKRFCCATRAWQSWCC